MKKVRNFVLILMLISAPKVFAGDMYLICENEKTDDFVSASIENGRTRMMLTIENNQPVLLDLRQLKTKRVSKYSLEIKFLKEGFSDQVELKHFQEINIGDYTCLIRD